MANLKMRYLITAILLIATATVVTVLRYDSSQDRNGIDEIPVIPMQIGSWKGHEVPLDASVYEILETKGIIHRNYTDELGNTVLLSIVHYQDTKVDFHAPEACLGGMGKKTVKTARDMTLHVGGKQLLIEVAEVLSSDSNGSMFNLYFYKTGNFVGQNYIWMRLNLAKNKIIHANTSCSLVRVSTSLLSDQEEMSRQRLIGFISEFYPSLETAS